MSVTQELVYVQADIYQPNDREYTEALLDWSDDLWMFPGRPDLSDIMDATEETAGDDSMFKTLAIRFTMNALPNPAFLTPEHASYIGLLQANASDIDLFEVDAEEQWWPLVRDRMAAQPNANQIGFYAVYAVTEMTRKDENGTNTSIDFEYVGELDFARLLLVQS